MKRSNRLVPVPCLLLAAVDDLSLRLSAPTDVASAAVTTIGVTQPRSVDEHGVLPARVVPTQLS